MRLLADENVHADVIHGLHQAEHEVLSVQDIGLRSHKDREILDYSEKQDLILISGDKDFGGLIEFGTLWGRGRVVLRRMPECPALSGGDEWHPLVSPPSR